MASRRDEKDRLRQEREQREAAAKSAQRRRQLIGYGVGGAVVLIAVVVAIALMAGGGGGNSASADVLPDGGQFATPDEDVESVEVAAKGAGCELESHRAKSREHVASLDVDIDYASTPPTSGNHYQEWADDAAYEDPPDPKELVHTMEHGRVIVWFKEGLTADQRAALKAYYDHDPYQLVLTPYAGKMPYDVAVTAWNREPTPNGTGRLLGCPNYNDRIFTAIEAFKDENRGIGPEPVP